MRGCSIETKVTLRNSFTRILKIAMISSASLCILVQIDKSFGLLITFLFLLLAIAKRPYYLLAAVLILVVGLFSFPTIANIALLNSRSFSVLEHSLSNIFSPNSGQDVLPFQVQQMLDLMETHQLNSYQLSDQIYLDPLVLQRITEGAWPIKIDAKSPNLLGTLSDIEADPACILVAQRESIALGYCH